MQIDIKTADIKPIRNTFDHVAKRLGKDKPASRYQEATYDIQPETNFHYRPLWDPEHLPEGLIRHEQVHPSVGPYPGAHGCNAAVLARGKAIAAPKNRVLGVREEGSTVEGEHGNASTVGIGCVADGLGEGSATIGWQHRERHGHVEGPRGPLGILAASETDAEHAEQGERLHRLVIRATTCR